MTGVVPAPRSAQGDEGAASLGIVVVSFGSAELLRRNLATIDLASVDARIVVVDNFSSVENRRAVEALGAAHGWCVVGMPDNRGFGAACNAGVAAARELGCRTFLFLNPDAVIAPDVVAELRDQSLREPMSLISPQLVDSNGVVVFRAARTDLRDGRVRRRPAAAGLRSDDPGDWLCGACVVVHDQLLQLIGGYDEGYFLYWEDVDLGFRAVAAGATVVLRDDLVAVHDEGGTHDDGRRGRAKSALYYRYNTRNRLTFAARNLGRRQLLRWMLTTPAVSWEILLRGGRRQLLDSPRLLWAAVAGSVSGLAQAVPALVRGRPGSAARFLVVHPGAELYGSDRVLLESVTALLARGEVTVALPGPGPLVAELAARGARVVVCRMPVLRKAVLRPAGLVRLGRDAALGLVPALGLVLRSGRDGVYVSTTILPFWVVLGRLAGRRVVCHVHEAEWPGPIALRRALLAPLLTADVVIANSRFTVSALTSLLPRLTGRITVVPNPVAGPTTSVPPRKRITGPVRLLFLGRLSPRKGPDVAIEMLRELVARGIDAKLELLGSVYEGYEWFEADLRRLVTSGELADRVDFLGFRPDVWPALQACDVAVIPSVLDESFGNAAVEAVLAARPSVVSALDGLREASEGYLSVQVVEPGRPDLWADAVERLLAGWAMFRRAAITDAGDARLRHAGTTYRERLTRTVLAAGPDAPGRGEPAARRAGEDADGRVA